VKSARSELKEHLKPFVELGHLSKWAIPSQIALVTEIPKTSVGKLDKKRIRRRHHRVAEPTTAPSFRRFERLLARRKRHASPTKQALGLSNPNFQPSLRCRRVSDWRKDCSRVARQLQITL
jgi:hypothetical protein